MADHDSTACPTCGHDATKTKRPYLAMVGIGAAICIATIGVGFDSGHTRASVPAYEASATGDTVRLVGAVHAEVSKETTAGASASEGENAAGQVPVVSLTSQELHDLFEANEAEANQKLAGYVIEVTGTIKSVEGRTDGNAQIFLETSNRYESTMLDLESSETSLAAKLVNGREVKVRCKTANYLIGTAVGHDCVIA